MRHTWNILDIRLLRFCEKPPDHLQYRPLGVAKQHIGASVGYDNSLLHGGVGFYVTVAEWGRWNFGIPSLGAGWTRYPTYDKTQ